MDYERIEKTQSGGGGFSPGKLRSMLMGAERRKKQEELEFSPALRSGPNQIDDPAVNGSDDCKDVDVVSDHRPRDQSLLNSRAGLQVQEHLLDYNNGDEAMCFSTSVFEFQKAEKAPQRIPIGPFSKPTPSKWDDAQKWIASPTPNRSKAGQIQVPGSKKAPTFGYGSRQFSMKMVEVSDQKMVDFEEPHTKRIDVSEAKKVDPYKTAVESYVKPVLMVENTVSETAINLSQHDSSISTAFIQPPPTARSVSMRDMGTEMTPIASQEPSRTGTPVRATTPIRSPISSMPSSPGRQATAFPMNLDGLGMGTNKEMSEKELQIKTRREIMMLGTQLGKLNIAAWASKEEEDNDASSSLKTRASEQAVKTASEARANAWEEAEKAKYLARFKREEMKIQAWENHQNAKSEAEMRKIEVEVERIKGKAQDRLMKKIAAVSHKAEEKRAAAEAKRDCEAAKTEKQADQIRKTGKVPSSFSCFWLCS
ncbi:PREDICTED: uncharacterized protein LOC104824101 [Tarenaya hassleriana]|uniref:uncharacterized protein LOC104824101 n=1 Tax=Tarenaya hassleriana TaxID=28532 RepID=UPI00053C3FDF|nr:PREDICTED: uncharacterized protein LOC104824101 [Tarenaya hassleriana]